METVAKISTTENILKLIESSSIPSWMGKVEQSSALDAFSLLGVPNRKSEEYKYVNMELALKGNFSLSGSDKITSQQLSTATFLKDAIVIVIENGVYNKAHSYSSSLPKGVEIVDISEASSNTIFQEHFAKYAPVNSDPFIALNTALALGGVFVHVAKNAVVETPLHIIHLSSVSENSILNYRNLIVVEENAQLTLIESYETIDSSAKLFGNALTEIVIGASAIIDHYKIQDEGDSGNLISTTQVIQKKQSNFSTHVFTLSGLLVRNNLTIVLDDQHIETQLNGLYITNGNQVVDNHTLVDHRKPNCNSSELYKGIIEDKSSATFNGKIYVRKDAQKTNAFQSNKNILLSDDGTINTKPQLEIYADDVKCSHGTSTGKLDEDKIFYLRARGLSEISAKKLLMHAFASEVVDTVKIEALREYIETKISKRFE
jgi:Fe-S cluster assembly protein SufD